MTELLAVEGLTKVFKDSKAVDDLSFSVAKGEVYGFLGQNGAGKSTTLRMLLSLIKPTSGSIRLFNRNILTDRMFILQHTGALIEKPDLYRYLSAFDNLNVFARLSQVKISKNDILEQLRTVGLYDRAYDKVGTFSQGMKQRLGIAIALIHKPSLIVLDEPTNGLDPQGIVEIRNLILDLAHNQHKTIIVSSHMLSEIELIASSILILNKGKKMVEGKTIDLISPEKTNVRIKVDDLERSRQFFSDHQYTAVSIRNHSEIELTIAQREIPHLVHDLVNYKINIYSISQMNNLERYFIDLTA